MPTRAWRQLFFTLRCYYAMLMPCLLLLAMPMLLRRLMLRRDREVAASALFTLRDIRVDATALPTRCCYMLFRCCLLPLFFAMPPCSHTLHTVAVIFGRYVATPGFRCWHAMPMLSLFLLPFLACRFLIDYFMPLPRFLHAALPPLIEMIRCHVVADDLLSYAAAAFAAFFLHANILMPLRHADTPLLICRRFMFRYAFACSPPMLLRRCR